MMVKSFLVQGAGAAVAAHLAKQLGPLSSSSNNDAALVLFSLGADHSTLLSAIQEQQQQDDDYLSSCPVYLTETYGILGFDVESQENIELLEKGRGSEYGYRGGSGGQGCLVSAFEGCTAGHADDWDKSATTSLMVVADQSGAWKSVQSKAPLHYGGITKKCWKVVTGGSRSEPPSLEPVPFFWIADTFSSSSSSPPIGVCAFEGDASEATKSMLQKMPSTHKSSGSVGLFPCFTRGVNEYGAENVETRAIEKVLFQDDYSSSVPSPRVYGMFAHGELGPTEFADFVDKANNIPCTQHSHTSILAIHTSSSSK